MTSILVKPVLDLSMRKLCVREYYNHKKGCPNFNKKEGCPPYCPTIDKTLDLSKPVYAIYNIFDFAGHVNKMQEKHSGWSKRQVECCLYWQPRARKILKGKIAEFLKEHRGLIAVGTPEAQGVNLTETMRNAGIELEWPPVTKTYQIVLAGSPA